MKHMFFVLRKRGTKIETFFWSCVYAEDIAEFRKNLLDIDRVDKEIAVKYSRELNVLISLRTT